MKRIRKERMLDVRKRQLLMLLLVIQAQNNSADCLFLHRASKKPLHLPIDMRPERDDLVERWAGKRSAQFLLRDRLAERVVIAVEEPSELFSKRLVVLHKWPKHERLEEPGGMSLMPFNRARVWA